MKDVIVNTLNELKASNWKSTFSESVLSKVCDAIGEGFGGTFWNNMCCGRQEKIVDMYFEGDQSVLELYHEVEKLSNQGGFKMPAWGTYGT